MDWLSGSILIRQFGRIPGSMNDKCEITGTETSKLARFTQKVQICWRRRWLNGLKLKLERLVCRCRQVHPRSDFSAYLEGESKGRVKSLKKNLSKKWTAWFVGRHRRRRGSALLWWGTLFFFYSTDCGCLRRTSSLSQLFPKPFLQSFFVSPVRCQSFLKGCGYIVIIVVVVIVTVLVEEIPKERFGPVYGTVSASNGCIHFLTT